MSSSSILPIDHFLEDISQALRVNQNLVITAAPGAGKTTRLPPFLLGTVEKKVIVLEPRRMAAIAATHRIADEKQWEVGKQVGYQVRFANKASAETRLIFMTEALLARQMTTDPELNDVDLVILDEFHERSLHVDIALGLLRELQELGRNIKIVVMSATLDADKIADYLGGCPIINVPGKLYPLEVKHQKSSQLLKTIPLFFENLTQTVKEASSQTQKDILVFLPGVGEIERARNYLQSWADQQNILLVPLHGTLSLEEQKNALKRSLKKRIILSTNIAESSVTLDGVDTVIDSGIAKIMRQDHHSGFSRLELGRISLSSATQRAGRAARQFPGTCYRLWNKMDEISFNKNELAEIQRIDLTESLLFLAAQGISDFNFFNWFEKPSTLALQSAIRFLKISGALSEKSLITPLGKRLLHFPLPVRLGKLIHFGVENSSVRLAASLAALLQERDIFKKDSAHAFVGDNFECDLMPRLEALEHYRTNRQAPRESVHNALQIVLQSANQIEDLARRQKKVEDISQNESERKLATQILIVQAFADRLCRRRGKSDRALMIGGRGIKLQSESLVKNSEFFVALNGVEGGFESETLVSLACGFSKEFVIETFKNRIEKVSSVLFLEEKGQFFVQEYRTLFGLPLEDPSLSPADQKQVAEKLPQIMVDKFDWVLKNNEALNHWWERLQFLDQYQNQEMHFTALQLEAFGQACLGETNILEVIKKELVVYFENVLHVDIMKKLKNEVPERLQMPSGSRITVRYPLDKSPYLEVRIQEIFGLMSTPKVLFGTTPITFHLLAPNFRSVQVTSNLESFWKNGYSEVRKELRIKYPKHQWPENPSDGIPEAKGRRNK